MADTLDNKVNPLDWRVPITNKDGTPTPEFQRKWAQQAASNGSIPDLSTPAAVSSILDEIGATAGDILARGTAQWSAVPPDTTGKILRTNGAGNLPSWDTLSAIMDLIGNGRSNILYRGASGWTVLAPDSGKLLQSGSNAADPTWQTISAMLDSIGSTRGSVLYRGASGWAILAPGTSGQVLQTNGAGADPTWATASGGGGYSPGTPPTVVQVAFNTSGVNVTFGATPANGNLIVAFTFNSNSNTTQSGWAKPLENSSGTDWGNVCTKTAGASEPTAQQAMPTTVNGGVIMWELHKTSGTAQFAAGISQAEVTGTLNSPLLIPNLTNCIGISALSLVGTTINYSTVVNFGVQDVLSNTGNRRMAGGHMDLSSSPTCGLLAILSGSGSTKGCTALFT